MVSCEGVGPTSPVALNQLALQHVYNVLYMHFLRLELCRKNWLFLGSR